MSDWIVIRLDDDQDEDAIVTRGPVLASFLYQDKIMIDIERFGIICTRYKEKCVMQRKIDDRVSFRRNKRDAKIYEALRRQTQKQKKKKKEKDVVHGSPNMSIILETLLK